MRTTLHVNAEIKKAALNLHKGGVRDAKESYVSGTAGDAAKIRLSNATTLKMTPSGYVRIALAVLFFAALYVATGSATEEYADRTGAKCARCHIDPFGGGALTEFGQGYLTAVAPATFEGSEKQGMLPRVVRLAALYLHIITAFLWFGTILYVHLVLKPAYASQGLPRGEVRVGLVSMAIMAVTGAVLTYYKVSDLSLLLDSKFGILLLAKIVCFLIMAVSALYVVFIIGPKLKKKSAVPTSPTGNLTLDELAGFDGEDGRPAYFAYQGKIYDVSQSKLWRHGNHMKRHQAGVDLTDVLAQAPHGEDKILSLREVGRLVTCAAAPKGEVPRKVFYFMAYMNLGFVFVIALILALWRW